MTEYTTETQGCYYMIFFNNGGETILLAQFNLYEIDFTLAVDIGSEIINLHKEKYRRLNKN